MSTPNPNFNKALALFGKRKYEKALNLFKKVPDDAFPVMKHYHIGMCYAKLGKYQKALNSYRKVREIPMDKASFDQEKVIYGMYVNMGSVLQVMGRRKMKISTLQRAKKAKSTKEGKIWQEMLHDAINCYEYALQVNNADARLWNNLGNCYLDLGNYKDAHRCFDEAISRDPEFPEAHYSKSLAYQFSHIIDRAIEELKKAVEFKPDNKIYLMRLVALLLGKERFDEAEKFARQFVKSFPKLPEAHKFLSLILYNKGDHEKAFESYQTLMKLDPDFHDDELEDIFDDLKKKAS